MRDFGRTSFSLRSAPLQVRLIYAGFLVLVGIGVLSQLGFEIGRIGVTPNAVALYYRGGEQAETMTFAKPYGQLLEVTHAHAFMMAVIFLILAHLFVATSVPRQLKAIVLAVTFTGTVGDLAAPWLVRYGAAWWASLMLASWAMQGLGNLALLVVSGWECLSFRSDPIEAISNGGHAHRHLLVVLVATALTLSAVASAATAAEATPPASSADVVGRYYLPEGAGTQIVTIRTASEIYLFAPALIAVRRDEPMQINFWNLQADGEHDFMLVDPDLPTRTSLRSC